MDFLKNTWAKIKPWTGTMLVALIVTVAVLFFVFRKGVAKKQIVG